MIVLAPLYHAHSSWPTVHTAASLTLRFRGHTCGTPLASTSHPSFPFHTHIVTPQPNVFPCFQPRPIVYARLSASEFPLNTFGPQPSLQERSIPKIIFFRGPSLHTSQPPPSCFLPLSHSLLASLSSSSHPFSLCHIVLLHWLFVYLITKLLLFAPMRVQRL